MIKKEEYKCLIDQCLEEECSNNHWCLLKEIIISAFKIDPRTLVQMKCVEIYKYYESKRGEIDWNEALTRWVLNGYAKKFETVYNENPTMKPQLMYNYIVNS